MCPNFPSWTLKFFEPHTWSCRLVTCVFFIDSISLQLFYFCDSILGNHRLEIQNACSENTTSDLQKVKPSKQHGHEAEKIPCQTAHVKNKSHYSSEKAKCIWGCWITYQPSSCIKHGCVSKLWTEVNQYQYPTCLLILYWPGVVVVAAGSAAVSESSTRSGGHSCAECERNANHLPQVLYRTLLLFFFVSATSR